MTSSTRDLETTFKGLEPSTTYLATVAAADVNGTAGVSARVEFKTREPKNISFISRKCSVIRSTNGFVMESAAQLN